MKMNHNLIQLNVLLGKVPELIIMYIKKIMKKYYH